MAPVRVALEGFVQDIEESLAESTPERIAGAVRDALARRIREGRLDLPEGARAWHPDRHARRLVHRDLAGRFCVVAMAWGPGRETSLHDHGGSWCVEGVVEGVMKTCKHVLVEERDGRCRFVARASVISRQGDADRLVPPFEHHVFGNPSPDEAALTLHVYGPELLHCNIYEPDDDGWWIRRERALGYDPW